MKTLFYFGENRDFSDRWLISLLTKYFRIVLIEPQQRFRLSAQPDLIVNRLYTSAIERYGEKRVLEIVKIIRKLEKEGVAIINSSKGYLLDLDREKQYKFFSSRGFSFARTSKIYSILSKKEAINFPCVLKINPSGRSKKLPIIQNQRDLSRLKILKIPLKQKVVLQPLIKKRVCYRSEFIGGWSLTYIQNINFYKKYLDFHYDNKVISTPLSNSFSKRLCNEMKKIGIQIFSIEYFLKNRIPIIIDFNLTSNYPRFFIEKSGGELKKAWLNLIKNEIL